MADNLMSSPSKRVIYNKLLDIAEKYTDVEQGDFLKTGLFGYITESMAMAIRDGSYHRTMLYNETNLNTAIMPETIYSWAKLFDIEIQKAIPAYANVKIKINKESLDALFDNGKTVILSRNDPIYAGDYVFSLEKSVKIERNGNVYSAEYDKNEEELFTEYQNQTVPLKLNTYPDIYGNIIVSAKVYQYNINEFTRQIPVTSFMKSFQKFDFEDQFCGAKLFYKAANNEEEEIELKYSELVEASQDNKFAFYSINNTNEFELRFKYDTGYFMPTSNSYIKLQIFTTKGSNIPKSFSGDAYMQISQRELKNLPIVINFDPITIIGGRNTPSLSNLKKRIISEMSMRNIITTKDDLNKYFEIISASIADINNGKVTFRKIRDDVLRRSFNAYLLLRTGLDDFKEITSSSSYISACIPTNTIDGKISIETDTDADNNESSIKRIGISYPKFSTNNYTLLDDSTQEEYYQSPFCYYIIPKNAEINVTAPCTYVKCLYDCINQEATLKYGENGFNNSNHYIEPVSIKLIRDLDDGLKTENSYKIELVFMTDFDIANTEKGEKNAVFNINGGSTTLELQIDESYSEEKGENLYQTVLTFYLNNPQYQIDSNFDIKLATEGLVLSSKENITNIDLTGIILSEKNDDTTETFDLGSGYTSDELVFFKNMDRLIDIKLSEVDDSYVLSGLPVVHSSFFESNKEEKANEFTSELTTYINLLDEKLDRLENSTFFNLKFYNTYGYSYLYNTTRTDLTFNAIIKLVDDYKDNDDLKNEIRSYIRIAIDAMNSNKKISYSSLVSLITNESTYGKYIESISLIHLNNSLEQIIEPNEVESEDDYIPEWLNIPANRLDGDDFIKFE